MTNSHGTESSSESIKVLFLDIDGVINNAKTPTTWKGRKGDSRQNVIVFNDPFCTFLVNRIVDRTGCKVVLSSSWRHSPTWREDVADQGIVFDLYDRTPLDGRESERGEQIKRWLEDHPDITRYAILDDNSWMLPEQKESFFKTEWETGITEKIAEEVERHFS